MTRQSRYVWLALWTCVGFGLVWGLLASLGLTLTDVWYSLRATPLWVWVSVAALTLINKTVGTLKWQCAAKYLARPVEGLAFWRLVELTNLGALFGQFIPVQLSTLLVRWFALGREARATGQVVGATFFEQSFDLILVLAGTLVAMSAILLALSPIQALGVFVAVVGATLLMLRPVLGLVARLFRAGQAVSALRRTFESAEAGFLRAADAPASVICSLVGYSTLRVVIVGLRAVVVMAAFVPEIASWQVFIATPAVSLLTALPTTPAGLGVVEWSWSAILVLSGATAAAGAIAALSLRLVTFATMIFNAIVLAVLTRGVLGVGKR